VLSLVRARLAAGQPVRVKVIGQSMHPLLQPGDHLWVGPLLARGARRGDLVVVQRTDDIITHRLVSAVPDIWHTRGDNCMSLDPPISTQAVLGRVIMVEQGRARLDLRCQSWRQVNWLLGWLSWLAGCAGHAARQQGHAASLPPGTPPPAPTILLMLYAHALSFLIRLMGALARHLALRAPR
jgi:hypothetical protein